MWLRGGSRLPEPRILVPSDCRGRTPPAENGQPKNELDGQGYERPEQNVGRVVYAPNDAGQADGRSPGQENRPGDRAENGAGPRNEINQGKEEKRPGRMPAGEAVNSIAPQIKKSFRPKLRGSALGIQLYNSLESQGGSPCPIIRCPP